ncbi:MAG: 2-C-methyl-D-erythritol 2,4-cyclodiphosphate synthase [Firmicutes bacterium ML8_F2]|jgi:2-C-methyl-D-erythritol 2,4-cyclodiphosphate synthase|nr:MAG: 2-C-methyl-D-erythritol 2,4-cyclodiphosphate synthase [Firmicutes bacterium ML8_F2]
MGFDQHRLTAGRPLVIGGVEIDFPRGLEGHSDADVLLHALMDALLGAAGQRDIGFHFPPDDSRYRGISSLELLVQVKDLIERDDWQLANADLVVIAEEPKMAPYIEKMNQKIASALGVAKTRVSVKATTTEGLGSCGRGEGIAAAAVVLLEKKYHARPAVHEAE